MPSSTGFDLGSPTQRWDAFLQQLNVSDTATFTGTTSFGLWNGIRVVDGTTFTTIQAAIDDLPATGGIVFIPEGTYSIASTININTQSVCLIGAGSSGQSDIAPTVGTTTLEWTGSVGGTMFSFSAVSGGGNPTLRRPCLKDIVLDGADSAAIGAEILSVRSGTFRNLYGRRFTTTVFDLDVVASLGEARDTQHNEFSNIVCRQIQATDGSCFRLSGDSGANASYNYFENLQLLHLDSPAIEELNADSNGWFHVRIFRAGGGSARGVLLSSNTGSERARNEYYFHLAPGAGGLEQLNDASDNTIVAYDRGGGQPAPTITAGELHYTEMGLGATGWQLPVDLNLRPTGTGNSVNSHAMNLIGRDAGGTERTTTIISDLNGALLLTPITRTVLQVGVWANGSGFKHTRIASGTTGGSLHDTASATWTFTSAFADANYTLTATVDNPTGVPIVAYTENKAAGSIDIVIIAGSATAASGTLNLTAVHDGA